MSKSSIWIILKAELKENLRNYRLLIYSGAIAVFSILILQFAGSSARSSASLLNLILLAVPLFGLLFSALSFRDSQSFILLMLSRGVTRLEVFTGKWLGLGVSLSLGLAGGILIGSIGARQSLSTTLLLLVMSLGLQWVFVSLALCLAVYLSRREMIPGIALLIWFFLYVVYDLLMIAAGTYSNEFPLEGPVFALMLVNPLDLMRMVFLVQTDLSDLMGFSAAFAVRTIGGTGGAVLALAGIVLWIAAPFALGLRRFKSKDL